MQPESVSLFLARAPVGAHWQADQTQLEAVTTLCERVDGLPLAVELLAAATLAAAPSAIAEQMLARALDLEAPNRRPSRHRSLRAALDWSHGLLGDDERAAFRRLSVCRGFDLDTAAAVTAIDDRSASPTLVSRLVQRSLVLPDASSPGAGRYRILHVVREYASEQLEASGEAEAIRDLHAAFFVARAAALAADASGSGGQGALDQLDADIDNLRAALEHLSCRHQHTQLLRLVLGTQLFWNARHPAEGLLWYRRLLDHADDLDEDQAATLLGEAGRTALHAGQTDLAETLCRTSHALARRRGRPVPGAVYSALSQLLLYDNDPEGSLVLCEEGMAELAAAGDETSLLSMRGSLSGAAHALGDTPRAIAAAEENLEAARHFGNRTLEAAALLTRATAHRKVDLALAREHLAKALDVARTSGPTVTKWALVECGQVDLELGDLEAARAEFREAAELADRAADTIALAAALEGCAGVALAHDDVGVATRLLAGADRIRSRPRRTGRPDDVAARERTLAALQRAASTSSVLPSDRSSSADTTVEQALAICRAWVPGATPAMTADDALGPGLADPAIDAHGSLCDLIERYVPTELVARRHCPPGATLFRFGDAARHVYIVIAGAVKQWLVSRDGREVVWSVAGPGDLVGDIATLTNRVRWCNATTIGDAVVMEIPAVAMWDVMRRRPDFSRAWLTALAERVHDAAQRQFQFGTLDALGRVCACLLTLADRFGVTATAGRTSFDLPFPQHDLAAWAGLSREALVPRAPLAARHRGADHPGPSFRRLARATPPRRHLADEGARNRRGAFAR